RTDVIAADEYRTDTIVLPDHRSNDRRFDPDGIGAEADAGRYVAVIRDVGIVQHRAPNDRPRSTGFAIAHPRHRLAELFLVRAVIGGHVDSPVIAEQVDRNHLAREQPLAALEDLVENGLGVGNRAADSCEDLARRALLLECLL